MAKLAALVLVALCAVQAAVAKPRAQSSDPVELALQFVRNHQRAQAYWSLDGIDEAGQTLTDLSRNLGDLINSVGSAVYWQQWDGTDPIAVAASVKEEVATAIAGALEDVDRTNFYVIGSTFLETAAADADIYVLDDAKAQNVTALLQPFEEAYDTLSSEIEATYTELFKNETTLAIDAADKISTLVIDDYDDIIDKITELTNAAIAEFKAAQKRADDKITAAIDAYPRD